MNSINVPSSKIGVPYGAYRYRYTVYFIDNAHLNVERRVTPLVDIICVKLYSIIKGTTKFYEPNLTHLVSVANTPIL